ncbi:3-oxoacyl-[acyl-carrier-protein] reductase FabG-like [Pararge aegeria]|uniref:Jg7395 protein n=1 Tax=Pararge aegeria aegeria TaxID=348720 RepID=A0A8S4RP69_9NEOP|nr:3-oxoacyl-[acyl-carrier-protein] reductase FabG-like [Pararge aegeria]CAH2240052.1 jg7395 [Pararge aegeria aegeria]
MSLKNKVVIITGASSGIGAATAVAFSAQGANVAMVGRNEAKLTKVATQCSKPLVLAADMAKDDDVKRIVEQTINKFGKIDILINNAGKTGRSKLLDNSIDMIKAYDAIMNVNVRGLVYITSLAAPYLAKTKGNIVNISSTVAFFAPAEAGAINYYISKAAVHHFGACAAAKLAPHGIRVNTVSPGPVKTDLFENSGRNANYETLAKLVSLGRVSEPEEIADVILFLASDKAKGITGSDFLADNGMLIKRG